MKKIYKEICNLSQMDKRDIINFIILLCIIGIGFILTVFKW